MTEDTQQGALSLRTLALVCGLAWLVGLVQMLGGIGLLFSAPGVEFFGSLILLLISELAVCRLILAAAGGFGNLAVRRLTAGAAPALRAATACLVGLWMLSLAVLVLGSLAQGLLTGWVWWIAIAAGAGLTAWRLRGSIRGFRLPDCTDGRGLLWVLIALAAGIWMGAAVHPPGIFHEADAASWHLQVPREFYHLGRIVALDHNVHSFNPLSGEMLYLLAMCLRGGPYDGMYAAQLLHGCFLIVALAGVYGAMRREDGPTGRFAIGLLATVPAVLYLAFTAGTDLLGLCGLTLATLWARRWLADRTAGAAVCMGAGLGVACAAGYHWFALAAVPVGVMSGLLSLSDRRGLARWPLCVVAGVALASPWLVRNTAATGNPVFPRATDAFGRAHLGEQGAERWRAAHASTARPPVPEPPGWTAPPATSAAEKFYARFLTAQWLGSVALLLAVVAVCVLVAQKTPVDPWQWLLAGTAGLQLLAWIFLSPGMPETYVIPVMVPISLLAAGALGRLTKVQTSPIRRAADRPAHGPWGLAPAVGLFIAAAGINLLVAHGVGQRFAAPPVPGERIAAHEGLYRFASGLGEDSRLLLVGEAAAFYYPADALYATPFDANPLAETADLPPAEALEALRARGVTHVWVDWRWVLRYAGTIGYPPEIGLDAWRRAQRDADAGLDLLERLAPLGVRPVVELRLVKTDEGPAIRATPPLRRAAATRPVATTPATAGVGTRDATTATAPTAPATAAARPTTEPAPATRRRKPGRVPPHWPLVTVYALPGAATAPAD